MTCTRRRIGVAIDICQYLFRLGFHLAVEVSFAVQMGLLTPETLENEPGGPAR
jgi:hypothetical protein